MASAGPIATIYDASRRPFRVLPARLQAALEPTGTRALTVLCDRCPPPTKNVGNLFRITASNP